jgi:HPt (histidine-containing phosphotransfer) domain-containing protein
MTQVKRSIERKSYVGDILVSARSLLSIIDGIATKSTGSFLDGLREIADIDAEIGLSHFTEAETMYREEVELFHKKLLKECDNMSAYLDERDANDFSVSVHAMKSALAIVGAEYLSKTAANMETAIKKGDTDYCLEQFPAFKEKLFSLRKRLSAVFPNTEPITEK